MCVLHETRYSQHDYSTDVWSPSVACHGKIESFSMKKSKRFTPFAHSFQDQYELSIKFFKIGALLFWSLLWSLVCHFGYVWSDVKRFLSVEYFQ